MPLPEVTADTFTAEVLTHRGLVLVDFYGPHCGACVMMLPVLEEVAVARDGVAKLVKINAAEHPELAARYRVTAVPNFVLFRAGEPIGQKIGRVPKADLLAWLAAER